MVGPGSLAISLWKRGLKICLRLLFNQSVKFDWFDFIHLCFWKGLACLSRFYNKKTVSNIMQDSMFFFPLDFWVATHLVVYPKSRRRLGSHRFGHYYLKAVKKNLSIFIMSLHYDKHVIFHGLTRSPPWGIADQPRICANAMPHKCSKKRRFGGRWLRCLGWIFPKADLVPFV